jgi:putative ATP-dependent endonuclease of the OLD family
MDTRITLRDFQSFDATGATLAGLKRINVIVGPNNSGKSKLLRAVDRTIRAANDSLIGQSRAHYQIDIRRPLTESELKTAFRPGYSGGGMPGEHWGSVGQHLMGTIATITIGPEAGFGLSDVELVALPDHLKRYSGIAETARQWIQDSVRQGDFERLSSPVYYIAAERDVVPEPDQRDDKITESGDGVTNLVRRILNSSAKEAEPVEKWLLADLNRIMAPEYAFRRIRTRHHEHSNLWEIYLEEDKKGWVPLSQCGSGLKTVLHLLAYTNLQIGRRDDRIKVGTFLIEEIENCLHAHVQRNIFQYLDDIVELPARVFMTTHSPTCLNFFQGHSDAALTHVYQEGGITRAAPVEAFQDKCGVLDRIGAKASDALQSDSVVWVEGPSDRVLLKLWFALCGADDLKEGIEYSVMFFGGDLLAHLTMNETVVVEESKEVAEYIRLLRINRNSAIIIDSDKRRANEQIRQTKQRVKDEAEAEGRLVWITDGKELENYVAQSFLDREFDAAPQIDRYEPPWPKLVGVRPKGKTRGLHTKVDFAQFVAQRATEADFQFDWKKKTVRLIEFIRRANAARH